MKKTHFILLSALVVMGLPLAVLAQEQLPNFGFVPNMGEASVSKIDLISRVTVARYYTAPRYGQLVKTSMAADFGVPQGLFPVIPADWRTSRIAIDPDGNAWVLNTGADCFEDGVEKAYLNGLPIQGTVVRIQGDTSELLVTSGGHDDVLTFGTDQAVHAYPVGAPNEIPRTVTFDLDGYLWIGFHMAAKKWGYFQKYTYDKCLRTLNPVGDPVTSFVYDIAPYNAALDKNGVLWFASYGSARLARYAGTYAADHGMYSFDTDGPGEPVVIRYEGIRHELGTTAYGVLVDNTPPDPLVKVYATSLEGGAQMWVRDITISSNFVSIPVNGADGLRSLAFDKYGRIWIASSGNRRICWYDPNRGTSGYSGDVGNTPVGVGIDDAGTMWVVVRESNKVVTFTPPAPPLEPVIGFSGFIEIPVGLKPYAYGDFTRKPITFEISGHNYKSGTNRQEGLAGWTISVYRKFGDFYSPNPTATAVTDVKGYYRFTDLSAGDYRVAQELKAGWRQVYPASTDHYVTLPDKGPCDLDEKTYDFENAPLASSSETARAANGGLETLRLLSGTNDGVPKKFMLSLPFSSGGRVFRFRDIPER